MHQVFDQEGGHPTGREVDIRNAAQVSGADGLRSPGWRQCVGAAECTDLQQPAGAEEWLAEDENKEESRE